MSDPFSDPDAEVEDFPEHSSGSTDDDGNPIGGLTVERTVVAEDIYPADYTPPPDEVMKEDT